MARLLSQIRFHPASPADRRGGLYGWACCEVAGWWLDGLTVRRTDDGVVRVFLPERRDRHGGTHPIAKPVEADVRDGLERELVEWLRDRGFVA